MPQAKLAENTPLLPRHEAFISEYLTNGFNATQAAVKAGYSQKSAHAQATNLLKEPKVVAAIKRKQATLAVQVEYSHADWLRDTLEMVSEARASESWSAAFKGQELIGRHIGALTSDRRLSRDEAELFSYLGAEMQRLQTARESADSAALEAQKSRETGKMLGNTEAGG